MAIKKKAKPAKKVLKKKLKKMTAAQLKKLKGGAAFSSFFRPTGYSLDAFEGGRVNVASRSFFGGFGSRFGGGFSGGSSSGANRARAGR